MQKAMPYKGTWSIMNNDYSTGKSSDSKSDLFPSLDSQNEIDKKSVPKPFLGVRRLIVTLSPQKAFTWSRRS